MTRNGKMFTFISINQYYPHKQDICSAFASVRDTDFLRVREAILVSFMQSKLNIARIYMRAYF